MVPYVTLTSFTADLKIMRVTVSVTSVMKLSIINAYVVVSWLIIALGAS